MKREEWFSILLLLVLSLGIYYPSLFAPFNSVDDQLRVNHLLNYTHFSLQKLFFACDDPSYYRPLTTLSFLLDKYLWGLEESFMHLENILLHALNTVLLYLLGRRLLPHVEVSSPRLPLLAAAIFAIHPLNTEAVNWISARGDLLAGAFCLLALLLFIPALERERPLFGGLAALAFLLATLCKETGLFLLPCFLLLIQWRRKGVRPWRGRWVLFGFALLALVASLSLRYVAMRQDLGVQNATQFVGEIVTSAAPLAAASMPAENTLFSAAVTFGKVIGFYAVKLLQPFPLNFAIATVSIFYLPVGIAVLLLLTGMLLRRNTVDTLFLISAVLASSALLILMTGLGWTGVAERYMYIPSGTFVLGMVFLLAGPCARAGRSARLAEGAVMILCATFAWGTYARNLVWQDNLTLFQDTVEKSPTSVLAKNELACALAARHRDEEANAILVGNVVSTDQAASLNLARGLYRQGDVSGARALLLQRLADPGKHEAKILETLIAFSSEQLSETSDPQLQRKYLLEMRDALLQAKRLSNNGFVNYRLGRTYLFLGEKQQAQACFATAARLLPADSPFKEPATRLARSLAP